MKFVTKEEFDKAVSTLMLAVKNGQVHYGHYDSTEEMTHIFISTHNHVTMASLEAATFVSPVRAAEAKLLSVRNKLNKHKQAHVEKTKELESLEQEAESVQKVLALLKVK